MTAPFASIRVELPADRDTGDRSYAITIGAGAIGGIGPAVAAATGRTVVVVDAAVRETHGAAVASSLRTAGVAVTMLAVPSGESSKSVREAARLWDELARLAVDRRTCLVAVGGGVVGDLAGFVAATFARGLPFWQVPTTLVAQVDSAIGGKTGINLDAGKNLVGAFWQPRGVVADIDTLATLPDREFRSGLAEVVKYGMILDPAFFGWLEGNVEPIVTRSPAALVHVVERSAALKAHVVERDEYERTGLRAILNYGHTFAHAFETAAGYGELLHGEAVAMGMSRAARLAERLGRIGPDLVARQDRLLTAFGLPLDSAAVRRRGTDELLAIMGRDKKTVDGRLRFVLPTRLGQVELVDGIDPSLVGDLLAAATDG
ncbi:MAG: 3-dehydroquinate synthase [Planctomycetia bacterium]|nr:3-dehydroquinate synthase [Planctomycetia bacterium]